MQLQTILKRKSQTVLVQGRNPVLHSFLMRKGTEHEPSNGPVPFMFSWKDTIMLESLRGHLFILRRAQIPPGLTRSKALVKSTKARSRGRLCSRHFSCNCFTEKTLSMVDLPALKPHCASSRYGQRALAIYWEGSEQKIFQQRLVAIHIFNYYSHSSLLCFCNWLWSSRPSSLRAQIRPPEIVVGVCVGASGVSYILPTPQFKVKCYHCLGPCH